MTPHETELNITIQVPERNINHFDITAFQSFSSSVSFVVKVKELSFGGLGTLGNSSSKEKMSLKKNQCKDKMLEQVKCKNHLTVEYDASFYCKLLQTEADPAEQTTFRLS